MENAIGLTEVLAIYGAILASIVFGWNLYRDLHDRARLKINFHVRRIVQIVGGQWYAVRPDLGVAGASEQLFIVANVTNIGRRSVQWIGWGGKYHARVNGKDSFAIIPVALPKMLNEGDTHSEFTNLLGPAGDNVKQLFVWDNAEKHWKLSRRKLRELKREAHTFQGMP